MIHIVLDTNIYRNNPARDNLDFKALERLSNADLICLHIPYIVLREFQTQQRDIYNKDLEKSVSGLNNLSRRLLDEDILKKLTSIKEELEQESEKILSSAEHQITSWASNIGAKLHPLCLDQASLALEAYFQGKPPLKSVKKREDIPDSFIVQSIFKLHNDHNSIHVVANDRKVREAFTDTKTINTYSSLAELIETDQIQNELKEADLVDNLGILVTALEQFEDENTAIKQFLSNNIGEYLVGKSFYELSIQDDDNEVTILSYNEADNIQLEVPEAKYYGNGQFGVPFQLRIIVSAFFYILKSEYYSRDIEREHLPSVSDHNTHCFEAEDEFELSISGLVSITIKRDDLNISELANNIMEDSLKIDEISNIEVD
ncbi:PIN domain-containing protein [Leucothrix arctica]|uniref:PIN domain-containing protein n=1 Tax=Leucothrix arctica TaxID=1481894 RepID=UPI002482CECC|nr:PIN domain-containing protein [Leucothrix arctica]